MGHFTLTTYTFNKTINTYSGTLSFYYPDLPSSCSEDRTNIQPGSMIHHFLTVSLLSAYLCSAAPSEGQRDLELQHAENSVPHLGKKSASPVEVPSFTSGFLPPTYPKYMRTRFSKRAPFPASWQIGKREPWTEHLVSVVYGQSEPNDSADVPEKRAPWTGAWANIAWKPAALQNAAVAPGKRAPWTSAWGALLQPTHTKTKTSKRSAIPNDWNSPWENMIRSPQGFRFNDGGHDFLSRDVMYKRGGDFTSNLNSVPMIGKRDPEPYISSDGHPNSEEAMESYDYQDSGRLMEDSALYPRPRGPYHRTILTRVQRAPDTIDSKHTR